MLGGELLIPEDSLVTEEKTRFFTAGIEEKLEITTMAAGIEEKLRTTTMAAGIEEKLE